MVRFGRFRYQPVAPLGKGGRVITACAKHLALSKEAAIEGTVLLKNDGTLPLKKGSKVCLFGRGAGEYIFGGGGSGSVLSDVKISLADALKAADDAGDIQLFRPLVDHAENEVQEIFAERKRNPVGSHHTWNRFRSLNTLPLPDSLYAQAVEFGGTAIFAMLRYSSEGTLDGDRQAGKGDFELYDEEAALLARLSKDFEKIVVVLCTPGPVNTKIFLENPQVGAMLYPLYGGSFAGEALADIITGKKYPSGHLQHTLAVAMHDYPNSEHYYDAEDYVNCTEDIFVGYRYFETFCPEKVVYPFGYGLSYTTFDIKAELAAIEKNTVTVKVRVANTGSFAGKEVVQLYLTAPQGKLGKAKKVLAAFQKTRELKPGDSQVLTLSFDLRQFASFDDLGKIAECAFVLEKGEYIVSMGTNVRQTEEVLRFDWEEDTVTRRCKPYMAPRALEERLTASGEMEKLPAAVPAKHPPRRYKPKAAAPTEPLSLDKALQENRLDEFLAGLTDRELADLLHGHTAISSAQTGAIGLMPPPRGLEGENDLKCIPAVPTCDGPAGFRAVGGSDIRSTYFPCANTVSQSWNLNLARRIGKAGALEIKENNAGIWLAPALNIHRSPLCGRNFEYYSEDPLTTGLFGAATVSGIQSQKIAATLKHFCCNNKEINRKYADSRVSQRALREIYLRGFEICIKKADPWCIMTGYNLVNGERCSGNWEQLNGILKGEWKYPGVVMTDWWAYSLLEDDLYGGNDVKMPWMITKSLPGAPEDYDLAARITDGTLDRGVCMEAARRVLSMMDHFE